MAAADAGQHGGDMPVADVERLAELTVAPGDSRQPPLEGGDRELGAAALDLRREIEPDRLGIGRRLGRGPGGAARRRTFSSRRRRRAGCCRLAPSGRRPWRSPPSRQPAAQRAGRPGQGRGGWPPAGVCGALSDASAVSERLSQRLPEPSESPQARISRGFSSPRAGLRIMSDKAILSDIATPRQAGRITRHNSVTKRRRRFTMRQVIRADLDLSPTRPPTLERPRSRAARDARASQAEPSENPGTASLSAAGAGPGLGAGERKGRGGRSAVLPPAPGSPCSTPFCAATRPPPGRCAPAWRFRAPPPPPKSCASTPTQAALRDLRFAVGDPLGPAANLLSLWRDLAGRPPSLDPGRIADAAARLDLAVDPNGLAASLKACAGEGDPVSAAAKAAALAFSAFPDAPAGRSRNPRPLGVRPRPRHPAALAAARAADRDENSGPDPALAGRRSTAKAGRPSLAERRRRRDRARRRLRPRPRRRSCPPLRTP